MELNIIILILLIPNFVLFWVSFQYLRKLTIKITGVKNVKDLKSIKHFVRKSFTSSDILSEIFSPKKYSKKYPDDFKKARILVMSLITFFLPTIGVIFYVIFKQFFINKEFGIPLLLLCFILVSLIFRILLKRYGNRK